MTAGNIKNLSTTRPAPIPGMAQFFSDHLSLIFFLIYNFSIQKSSAQEFQPSEPHWLSPELTGNVMPALCVVLSLHMRSSWSFQMNRCDITTTSDQAHITASRKISLLPSINGSMLSNLASTGVPPRSVKQLRLLTLWQPLSLFWEQTRGLMPDSLEIGTSTWLYRKKRAHLCHLLCFPSLSITAIFICK